MSNLKTDKKLTILSISHFTGYDYNVVKQLLTQLSSYITNQLSTGNDVYLPGIGKFIVEDTFKWKDRITCKISRNLVRNVKDNLLNNRMIQRRPV